MPATPAASVSGLRQPRKSGIPASSPSKTGDFGLRNGQNGENDIANQLQHLQAAIRAKDPAKYASIDPAADLDEEEETLASPSKMAPRSNMMPAVLRKASAQSADRPSTPSQLPGRPGSSLSSSSYVSAHASSPGNRTPFHERPTFITPAKRKSDVHGLAASKAAPPPPLPQQLQVGDLVIGLGFEGILRYFGEVEFKAGIWGGIELNPQDAGRGKNDGSVQG